MPRRPCMFRETDVRRAVKAVRAAGVEIARVVFPKDGSFVVVPGKPIEAIQDDETPEDLRTLL
jgi:hypothetical protein